MGKKHKSEYAMQVNRLTLQTLTPNLVNFSQKYDELKSGTWPLRTSSPITATQTKIKIIFRPRKTSSWQEKEVLWQLRAYWWSQPSVDHNDALHRRFRFRSSEERTCWFLQRLPPCERRGRERRSLLRTHGSRGDWRTAETRRRG